MPRVARAGGHVALVLDGHLDPEIVEDTPCGGALQRPRALGGERRARERGQEASREIRDDARPVGERPRHRRCLAWSFHDRQYRARAIAATRPLAATALPPRPSERTDS